MSRLFFPFVLSLLLELLLIRVLSFKTVFSFTLYDSLWLEQCMSNENATFLSVYQCTVLHSCCEGCPSCIWRCSFLYIDQIFFSKLFIFWSCYDCYCSAWNFWSPVSRDVQLVFQCSAYPIIQALSLPSSPSQGVSEMGNNKTGTEEIQVNVLGVLWNFRSYQAMRFYW